MDTCLRPTSDTRTGCFNCRERAHTAKTADERTAIDTNKDSGHAPHTIARSSSRRHPNHPGWLRGSAGLARAGWRRAQLEGRHGAAYHVHVPIGRVVPIPAERAHGEVRMSKRSSMG